MQPNYDRHVFQIFKFSRFSMKILAFYRDLPLFLDRFVSNYFWLHFGLFLNFRKNNQHNSYVILWLGRTERYVWNVFGICLDRLNISTDVGILESRAGEKQNLIKQSNNESTSWSCNHVFVFSSSSRLLATWTIFCWSVVEVIALLFLSELYLTSWTSISREVESSLAVSLFSSSGFVKLARSVMMPLTFVESLPLSRSLT